MLLCHDRRAAVLHLRSTSTSNRDGDTDHNPRLADYFAARCDVTPDEGFALLSHRPRTARRSAAREHVGAAGDGARQAAGALDLPTSPWTFAERRQGAGTP